MLTKYYEASSIATAKAARIQCAFDRFFATTTTMPDKAMKRMEGWQGGREVGWGKGEAEGKGTALIPCTCCMGSCFFGHYVWRSSVAAGHKSSAKTADCSQKRKGESRVPAATAAARPLCQVAVKRERERARERGRGRQLLATNLKKSPAQLAPAA